MLKTKANPVAVPVLVPVELLYFTICAAFEGGINYWARLGTCYFPEGSDFTWLDKADLDAAGGPLSDSRVAPLVPGGYTEILDAENGDKSYRLNRRAISNGLLLMANDHARDFADLVSENGDADTADTLVQLALFGKLVYA